MSFRGTRSFRASTLFELVQNLGRFAQDVHDAFAEIERGSPRRWRYLPVVTGASGAAAFDYVLPVSPTGATCEVALPVASSEDAGREFAILRKLAATTITLVPSGGKLDGATANVTLPTTVGLYVFVADAEGVWRVRV